MNSKEKYYATCEAVNRIGIGLFVIIIGQGWLFELNFLKNIDLLTIDLRYQSRYERTEQTRELTKDGDVVVIGIRMMIEKHSLILFPSLVRTMHISLKT